jgi:hypothetical protein
MSNISPQTQPYSRYGIMLAGLFLAVVFYYMIRGATCDTTPMDCSRPLFLLSLPLYLALISIVNHFNVPIYAVIVVASSTLYTLGFYTLGEWIQTLRKPKTA